MTYAGKITLVALFAMNGITSVFAGSTGDYPAYTGQKRMAIIMLAWSDTACPSSRQVIVDRTWNNADSVRKYYRDMSRNLLDFIPPADAAADGKVPANSAAVYGPYTLSIAGLVTFFRSVF